MNGSFVSTLLVSASPYVLAGLGALASEHAGVLNIAMEGFMLLGAFVLAAGILWGLPPLAAVLLALLVCALGGYLMALYRTRFRADIFMTGIAFNLLIPGLIALYSSISFGARRVLGFSEAELFRSAATLIPLTALILVLVYELFLRTTRPGMRSTAVGAWPDMLAARGIGVDHYKDVSLVVSAVAGGLAGIALALALGSWVPGMSAGKGWIALILVYAGNKTPWGIALVALAYGTCELAALRYQQFLPLPLLSQVLPSVLLLLCLVAVRLVTRHRQHS